MMIFNDWLDESGYRPFADWVKDEAGWKPVMRFDEDVEGQCDACDAPRHGEADTAFVCPGRAPTDSFGTCGESRSWTV